jgi:MFS family permease
MMALLEESSPSDCRGRNIGFVVSAAALVGLAAAPVLTTQVAARWGWRPAFFVAGAPGPLMSLLVWRLRRFTSRKLFTSPQPQPDFFSAPADWAASFWAFCVRHSPTVGPQTAVAADGGHVCAGTVAFLVPALYVYPGVLAFIVFAANSDLGRPLPASFWFSCPPKVCRHTFGPHASAFNAGRRGYGWDCRTDSGGRIGTETETWFARNHVVGCGK